MATPTLQPTPTPTPLTPIQIADLHHRAHAVAKNAHAPYSNFRVGAAILLEESGNVLPNTILTGCNVENASYRLTTCAEQTAITSAVALYGPSIRIRAVVVITLNNAVCAPCGACRQTILEFSSPNTQVFFPGPDNSVTQATIADLLPHAFAADSLTPSP